MFTMKIGFSDIGGRVQENLNNANFHTVPCQKGVFSARCCVGPEANLSRFLYFAPFFLLFKE